MAKYIWQHSNWPKFRWNTEEIVLALSEAKKAQGYIIAQTQFFELKDQADILIEEAFTTSATFSRTRIISSVVKVIKVSGVASTLLISSGLSHICCPSILVTRIIC